MCFRYESILKKQVQHLLDHYWTAATMVALRPHIESVVRGDIPHASPVLMLLLSQIPQDPILSKSAQSPHDKSEAKDSDEQSITPIAAGTLTPYLTRFDWH